LPPAIKLAPLTAHQRRLVTDNLGLAHWLLKRYYGYLRQRNRPLWEDMRAAAYQGLCEAAARFRPTGGAVFSTFATTTIWGVMKRFGRDTNRFFTRHGSPDARHGVEAEDGRGFDFFDCRLGDPFDLAAVEEIRALVADALRFLGDRDRQVIGLRFGVGDYGHEHTTEEMAAVLDISLQSVRQWTRHAVANLKDALAFYARPWGWEGARLCRS
jgi:RNA polymerase sigma factor (sigma-70 family)